jgi:hypothetical protein
MSWKSCDDRDLKNAWNVNADSRFDERTRAQGASERQKRRRA